MRNLLAFAARSMGPALFGRVAGGLLSGLPVGADRLRLLSADAIFEQGDYSRSLSFYETIQGERHRPRANQMCDWIRFKQGDVSRGWPLYPGTRFNASALEPATVTGTIRVADPQRPIELVQGLGLRAWTGKGGVDGPLLVWFNFRSSLGGELLAAKLVAHLQQTSGMPVVLACDPRLVDVLRIAFPGNTVVSREDDLAWLKGVCSRFILARDVLSLVVSKPEDLDVVGATTLIPSSVSPREPGPMRVALAWKTTNPRQARFRNLPIRELASALAGADLELHSAQHGVDERDRHEWGRWLGDRVRFDTIDPSGTVGQMTTQLARMDLVVTIDNTLLHVAGAAGLPAIGLLSVPSYWAWPMTGESSRWYPSVRLLHQGRPGQWQPVMGRLSELLPGYQR